jgi:acetolactate synthase I/II/III large subunit
VTESYGSDVVVDVLVALGIEEIAFNPGASFRGLHDSLVHRHGSGGPRLTMTLHEEIAVAAAHGYAKASARPMAVALHDVVGLQHACMALFNAWCDRVPVLAIGATGPVAADRRRPWIDWIHTANVQGGHVRDFVKWDDQPMSVPAAVESLQRAFLLATTPPAAPTYVCLPVEVQEDEVHGEVAIPAVSSVGRAAPDSATIDDVARAVGAASHPVIVADRAADRPGAVEALSQLAAIIGAPILDRGSRMNVATVDPHDLTGDEAAQIAATDLILAFEVSDLAGMLDLGGRGAAGERPPIVDVSLGANLVGSWAADYQRLVRVDRSVPADAALVAAALAEACSKVARDAGVQARNDRIAARHDDLRAAWRAAADSAAGRSPISTEWLAREVGRAIGERRFVLSNGTLNGWARRLWDWREPGSHIGGNGGGGIGYGIGATVGAALAHRDTGRLVVNLQPDGDLLYAPSALWTLANQSLPVLTVVWNNGGYRNSEEHSERIARRRQRSLEDAGIGNRIEDPSVDFVSLARAYGMRADGPIIDPSELGPALGRAVAAVDSGEPALVEVRAAAR